jgi:hypothetical protein
MIQSIPLYDIHTAAWLQYKGISLELIKHGGRVVFEAPATEETAELLHQYEENPSVPLLDYVSFLRRLRSRMAALRDGNGRRDRKYGRDI